MPVTKQPANLLKANVASFPSGAIPKIDGPEDTGIIRKICLAASNAILQFPIIFEIQQALLDQPDLLRREVDEEVHNLQSLGETFKVIDYGCGSGTYTGLFGAEHYLGIDCSEPMLMRAANQHPNHSFVQATDLSGIRHSLEDVSHILMIGVIHHLPEWNLLSILSSLPKNRPIRFLSIDTLKCPSGRGRIVQLFERGEFLREEADHKRLLARVANEISYKESVLLLVILNLPYFAARLKQKSFNRIYSFADTASINSCVSIEPLFQ